MHWWIRRFVQLAVVFILSGCDFNHPPDHSGAGRVEELTDDDTILVTDLLGSPVAEITGSGRRTGHFATYPFGETRFDSSKESNKYTGVPRDAAVSLDAMGARYYAPGLATWTSADPLALTAPERLATSDFAAANPYAYAKNSPLLHADRDGHFWHIAIGAAVGGLIGGGVEAGRQFFTEGRVHDWGRVGAASTGGAVSGSVMAACPVAGLASFIGSNAAAGAAGGVAQRLVESGGKSAGTVSQAVFDAGSSVALAGFLKGGASLLKAAARRTPAAARSALGPSRPSQPSTDSVNLASAQRTTHILDGDQTGGGHLWPGAPGKTPFPASWSREEIMHHVSDIATDPSLPWVQKTGIPGTNLTRAGNPARFVVQAERGGIEIRVVLEPAGEGIISGFPPGARAP